MQDIKARIDEFKKMAAFADQLEDAGDDRRAQAVRIALYDRVQDTTKIVEARIQEKFGGVNEMMRMASSDGDAMTKAAGFWGGLLDTLKGLGRYFRGKPSAAKGVAEDVLKGALKPGDVGTEGAAAAVRRLRPTDRVRSFGREMANDWRTMAPGEGRGFWSRPITDAAGNVVGSTPTALGRGTAYGLAGAAGLGGAAALAGRGRGPEQRPGEGLPPTGGGGYPAGPAVLPPSGMPPMGGGGYPAGPAVLPPSGMPPMGGGGYGYGYAEAMSAIQGVQSKLAELEGRISRLEAGGR